MTTDKIKSLAEIFYAHNLTKLEAQENGVKIILERAPADGAPGVNARGVDTGVQSEAFFNGAAMDYNNLTEVKSPIVGVFYAAPSPDGQPFVCIGDKVRKGDVLCIIEAMKLLNEITADADGEIVDICIKNGDIAEYGQTLFKMA